MFLNEEESNERLSSLDNLVNRLNGTSKRDYRSGLDQDLINRKIHNGGRRPQRTEDSEEEKAEIAKDALIHGPTEAARMHDTTISRASLLSKGITTHRNGTNQELMERVSSKKEILHEKALDILVGALGNIDENINEVKKVTDLSAIAANISKVAERLSPKTIHTETGPRVQVVVYTPRIKDSSEYEEIVG